MQTFCWKSMKDRKFVLKPSKKVLSTALILLAKKLIKNNREAFSNNRSSSDSTWLFIKLSIPNSDMNLKIVGGSSLIALLSKKSSLSACPTEGIFMKRVDVVVCQIQIFEVRGSLKSVGVNCPQLKILSDGNESQKIESWSVRR